MTSIEELPVAVERLKEDIAKQFGIYKFLDWLSDKISAWRGI